MKKRGRPPLATVCVTVRLPKESSQQIDELSDVLHISRAAIISQAVARWYTEEPLIQRRTNGTG